MAQPTKVETLAEVVREELRKACSQFIGQVDRNCSVMLANRITEILTTAGQEGLLPNYRDVQFNVELNSQDPTNVILKPNDFYSALALQFLRGGIPMCNRLPHKSELGERWTDPAGNIWTFEGGTLFCSIAQPHNFINMTFEVQPEHNPPATPEVKPEPFGIPKTKLGAIKPEKGGSKK